MIVVDASFVLKLVFQEADTAEARAVWQTWENDGEVLIAPTLFLSETLSAVRRRVHRGSMSDAEGELASSGLIGLGIRTSEPATLYTVAWRLAKQFNRPNIYDSCYLALAFISGCDLWTADQRLANAVRQDLPWVRLLGV